jgi:pyruvate formate-lyase activating enzyme-like uncharacterized protein
MISAYVQELRAKQIAANLTEYGDQAARIRWADPARIEAAETRRAAILAAATPFLTLAAKQTKFHWGALSPGCRICTQGQWSCVFINGQCNCRCFYCPTTQNEIGVPTTNQLSFASPEAYTEYARRFAFSGVSISGGEPFLTFERAMSYIEAVRRDLGPVIHIWLYTNGTLVTRERLQDLKSAGLNEIRFDISAVNYDCSKAELAAHIIDCVTVEIPAIPEDADRLAALLPAMADAGVRHLNLHQLRLTPHNLPHLTQRDYSFLHGESVTVLESELTALALLQAAGEQKIPLPINYCSFVYKRRYQQAAARQRNAQGVIKGWESVTENGFIRSLTLSGAPERLGAVAQALEHHDPAKQRWTINTKQDRLQFHAAFWPRIDFNAGQLLVTYFEAILAPHISYRCAFKEMRLATGQKIFIEKRPVRVDLPIAAQERPFVENQVLHSSSLELPAKTPVPEELCSFEFIQNGLQDYY